MKRRDFIKGTGAGLAVGSAAALTGCGKQTAGVATQGLPDIRWRLASSFPKSLDTIYGAAGMLSERLAKITGGKFQIKVHAGGEIVPGLQVLDAVQNGTVECGHSASYYYVGKNMAFAFDCALPFGLTARHQNAWMYAGGGIQLMRELFAKYSIVQFPGGNTGTQIGGQIMARLGVVPQTIAGGDIYPSLEKGAIDAAEWVGPYDDEKLGFHKIAKNYLFPGGWEGGPQLSFYVNQEKWNSLPH